MNGDFTYIKSVSTTDFHYRYCYFRINYNCIWKNPNNNKSIGIVSLKLVSYLYFILLIFFFMKKSSTEIRCLGMIENACWLGKHGESSITLFYKLLELWREKFAIKTVLFKRTKSGQRTFYYRTVSLWNSLDNDLKLCNSSSHFKRKLKAKLFAAFLSPRS